MIGCDLDKNITGDFFSSSSLDKMELMGRYTFILLHVGGGNRSVGKHYAAKICIMLEFFLIQIPSMTTFSIWTFYNANQGGHLIVLLPVSFKNLSRVRK